MLNDIFKSDQRFISVLKPIIESPTHIYYRNKMEFSFSRTPNDELKLGLKRSGSFFDVVNLKECFLMSPEISKFLIFTREFLKSMLIWHGTIKQITEFLSI